MLFYPIFAQNESDLRTLVGMDGLLYGTVSNTANSVNKLIYYKYDSSSSASDDTINVIKPNGVSGSGRFIIWEYSQSQSNWSETDTAKSDYIKNKPYIINPSGAAVSRALNTSFQISTTQNAFVFYSINEAEVLTLTGGQTGIIQLQISPDNVTFTTIAQFKVGNTGTLTVGLTLTDEVGSQLSGFIPAGYWVKLPTSGTGTQTEITGQEVKL